MKITFKNETKVPFGQLAKGTTFMDKNNFDEDTVLIKLGKDWDKVLNLQSKEERGYVAVDLSNGQFFYYEDTEEVTPVDVELIVD